MKYKNISKQTQTLIGFGIIEPDEVIETEKEINNPNFELVGEPRESVEEPRGVKVKRDGRSKFNRKAS